MRLPHLLGTVIALGCAGTPTRPAPSVDPARAATLARLCEPLPAHAFDCVVGWPGAIAPARRDAVATASEGAVWANVRGVRAFASCADRPAEDGPVAQVISILVDTSIATPEHVAGALPVRVRLEEHCADATEDCAGYLGRIDGDRLVLTRRVQRPLPTELDIAQLTCAAVADGAQEARTLIDGDGALVREMHVETTGLAIVSRRPGGRGGIDRSLRTWTELDLAAMDERTEHESDVRIASMGRAMDPEEVDVTNETALDVQIQARRRQLVRTDSVEGRRALARLAQRGFEAHPSRPDLGVLAIQSAVLAHEQGIARAVLARLGPTLGDDSSAVMDLGVLVDASFGDAPSLASRLASAALGLDDARALADALIAELGLQPLTPDAPFGEIVAAARLCARASGERLPPRAPVDIAPVRGAPWAIEAVSAGPVRTVIACSDASFPLAMGSRSSHGGPEAVFVTFGHCTAYRTAAPMRFESGAAATVVLSTARGATRVFVEQDDVLVGVGGMLDASGALRVASASPTLTHADLARAQREVALPLDALGSRSFPPPTLALPIAETRRDGVIAATVGIEGVDCARSSSGVSCALESYEPVERLADAAFAAFDAR